MRPGVRDQLERAVGELLPLPIFSGTTLQVRQLAHDESVPTGALTAVIERDEGFTTNLLRYANSAAHAKPVRVRSVRQAVTLLGRRALSRLALEAVTYRFFEQARGTGGQSRGQLHAHAVSVCDAALAVASRVDADVETTQLAALLHDVGKLVLPVAFGAQPLDEIARTCSCGAARARLERGELGVDHAYAGAVLAERAGAAAPVVAAIRDHHGGLAERDVPSPEAACVQLANATVRLVEGKAADGDVIDAALNLLSLTPEVLDDIAQSTIAVAPLAPLPGSLSARVGELERLATTDDLTGVANRRHWVQTVTRQLGDGGQGVLLIVDVDFFKRVNDSFGHRAGDLVLSDIARILDRHGLAGRLGGDEFGVWLNGARQDARDVAQRIVDNCRTSISESGHDQVSVSVGLATAPHDGDEISALLESADAALYRAKTAGRDRYAIVSEATNPNAAGAPQQGSRP
jgi:diguanylate cyclase (GGDEF)-like protein/putative nucleotidyltransferase with HDIG domain